MTDSVADPVTEPHPRRPGLFAAASVATAFTLIGALLVGCGAQPPSAPSPVAVTAADGRGAIRPLPTPTGCTRTATDADSMFAATRAAVPGDRICVLGNINGQRLVLKKSGTAGAPITIVGDGRTAVRGVTVQGDYVTVSGLNAIAPHGPGISLTGNHLNFDNNTVISPRGDDGDGLRFWGTDITITHNTIRDTRHLNYAHADCMQTFATDAEHVASHDVTITRNRCESISNTCLIAEGPNSLGGDGSGQGQSANITFSDNSCDNHASEATEIDDVQHVTITNNQLSGAKDMAFSFQNNATGALVHDNRTSPDIDHQVGMDDSSKVRYQGPEPQGGP